MLIKKKLQVIISLLVLIAAAASSCMPTVKTPENEDTSLQDNISSYYPLKVGYEWEYEGHGNEYAAYTQRERSLQQLLLQKRDWFSQI